MTKESFQYRRWINFTFKKDPLYLSTMKRIIVLYFTVLFLFGCSTDIYKGELLGSLNRPNWYHIMPYGMVYVPSGTLHIGPSDQDVNSALVQRAKSVSVAGFYMDATEISNNEYRQFTEWVRDSIAHHLIGDDHLSENADGNEVINWRKQIQWGDEEVMDALEDMYYAESDRFWGKRLINPDVLNYEYSYIDYKEAAKNKYRLRSGLPIKTRGELIKEETVNVYPDTLVWVRDFSYSYNEPMTRHYFWHPAYDNYPVVGVTWKQASAFTIWRSKFMNDWRDMLGELPVDNFRLPNEFEWEYASRGGQPLNPYPWGGPYLRNGKGCILANFKPGRGNYPDDGGFYTVKVNAYWPNDFGLYNMSGNVAEWTADAFEENATSFQHDLNGSYTYNHKPEDGNVLKRKALRGGSWKDISYYLQTSTRTYEYADTAKSYIGFRTVMSFLGRSINDEY